MRVLCALAVLLSFVGASCAKPTDHSAPSQFVTWNWNWNWSEPAKPKPKVAKVKRAKVKIARRKVEAPAKVAAKAPETYRAPASNLVQVAERYIGTNPTGWSHLWCAQFLNAVVLPQAGLKGTGSALARSFENWGHPSGPVPGAIAVLSRRGRGNGHVTIVARINSDGTFDGLGGNQGRGGVNVLRMSMANVIAWRSP